MTSRRLYNFDLVVCAALAVSWRGLDTALIQERPVLGGNSSSEIRVPLAGAANFNPWARESGIIEELILTERIQNYPSRRESQINSVWDMVLYDACYRESQLELFLNTTVYQVKKSGNRLSAVLARQLGSALELEFIADYFIDATGDGAVAFEAGAEFRYGREARR